MNWNFGNQISMYGNLYGILYFYLVDEILENFGSDGEICARKATTSYGHFRGALLRRDHIKKGYVIDLKTFQSHYDLPNDERSKKTPKEQISPGETRSKTFTCQFSDIWKLLKGQEMNACSLIGRIYCEQFHPAMWEGYDSRLIVDLETYLTRGDDVCRFHTVTAKEPRKINIYMPNRADEYNWNFEDKMEVMANICAFEYFFLAKEAINMFGSRGEEVISAAITKYGECRGKLLAEYQRSKGIKLTLQNLFKCYDIDRERDRYQIYGNTVSVKNSCCRFVEICEVMENAEVGKGKIAQIYCKAFYPGLIKGYNAALGIADVKESYAFGNEQCTIMTK